VRAAWLPWLTFVLTVYAGVSMVSNAPFYSGKSFHLTRSVPFWVMVMVVFAFFVVSYDPPVILFSLFCAYGLSGYLVWAVYRARGLPNPVRPVRAPVPEANEAAGPGGAA
jgi:CDP-diacylglycerol--serine O-phosphatidyltransferase